MNASGATARSIVGVVSAAMLSLSGLTASSASAGPVTLDPDAIVIQAHRGGPALGAPQNSLALFRKAVASGVVDRIETDVRSTRDDVLVIAHDAKLPTSCTSAGTTIRNMRWADLAKVRCGGEPVPRLSDIFDTVRGSTVSLNLELKLVDGMTTAQKSAFAKAVVTTVLKAGLPKNQVGLSSFYWRSYAGAVQKYGNGIPMAAMEFATKTEPTDDTYSIIRRASALGVDAFALTAAHANERLLDFIGTYGKMRIGTQDRKSGQQTRYALAHGSYTFTSDDPIEARSDVDSLLNKISTDPLQLSLTQTAFPRKTVLSKKSMAKNTKSFPRVIGQTGLLPAAAVTQLDGVAFTVTVTGKGSGKLELAPSGSRPGIDGVRVDLPRGTKTYSMYASPGDAGKIRVMVTGTATVTVTMSGYRTATY